MPELSALLNRFGDFPFDELMCAIHQSPGQILLRPTQDFGSGKWRRFRRTRRMHEDREG